jgi:hypothetical protein
MRRGYSNCYKSWCGALIMVSGAMTAGAQVLTPFDVLHVYREERLRVTSATDSGTVTRTGSIGFIRDSTVFFVEEKRSLVGVPAARITKIDVFRKPRSLAEEEVRLVSVATVGVGVILVARRPPSSTKHIERSLLLISVIAVGLQAATNAAVSRLFERTHWRTVYPTSN